MSLPAEHRDQLAAMRPAIRALGAAADCEFTDEISLLHGGRNNRVYQIAVSPNPVVLKWYFAHPQDRRDRLSAEFAFCDFCWQLGLDSTPRPLAMDASARMAVYAMVPGRRLLTEEVTGAHVSQAAAFLRGVNRVRHHSAAVRLPLAAEACFSPAQHVNCVEQRVARLCRVDATDAVHAAARELVTRHLAPAWRAVRHGLQAQLAPTARTLPENHRCLSPSDFGFHNALWDDDRLRFIDFEYAGWDDPAKLVCDFFCQVERPVPLEHWDRLVEPLEQALDAGDQLRPRAAALLPVYRIKWCCIVLNEFLPEHRARRSFSGESPTEDQLERQLSQARQLIAGL